MGAARALKSYRGATSVDSLPDGSRLERGRPRSFAEWQALRRWGTLPPWERDAAGYLLREAREAAELTQKMLAARLGVSQQAIAQAERWNANPSVGLMRRWAHACGGSLELRFVGAGPVGPRQ